jgi:transposase
MPQNFVESRREQGFLLAPDVRDWLAPDHLAWFVIDAVAQLDLDAFYGAYRADGHGAAAYEPSMMVTLLLYAYATKQRSSRAIERHCHQDVAYRVITGSMIPDHATIARFVVRHEAALAQLFGEVLKLCEKAGLVKAGVIAVDGTRLPGDANREHNYRFEEIAREVLAQARATDEAEDEQHGEARGDQLPEQLRTVEGRRAFFRQVKENGEHGDYAQLDTPAHESPAPDQPPAPDEPPGPDEPSGPDQSPRPDYVFDAERIVARTQGREGWLRDARRQLDQRRWQSRSRFPARAGSVW